MTDIPAPAATAARAILGTLARTGLKIVGTALVTRGVIDQGTADGVVPMLAEEVVGLICVGAGSLWSVARARLTHTRFAAAWRALNGDA